MIAGITNVPDEGGTYPCPRDHSPAKLIVNFSSERRPVRDTQGNRQYYCLQCHGRFSVDRRGQVVQDVTLS